MSDDLSPRTVETLCNEIVPDGAVTTALIVVVNYIDPEGEQRWSVFTPPLIGGQPTPLPIDALQPRTRRDVFGIGGDE